jgi:hypothetical protein
MDVSAAREWIERAACRVGATVVPAGRIRGQSRENHLHLAEIARNNAEISFPRLCDGILPVIYHGFLCIVVELSIALILPAVVHVRKP